MTVKAENQQHVGTGHDDCALSTTNLLSDIIRRSSELAVITGRSSQLSATIPRYMYEGLFSYQQSKGRPAATD